MSLRFAILAAAFLVALCPSAGGAAERPFKLSATHDADGTLRLEWAIEPGSYLYRDKIGATRPDGEKVALDLPAGIEKDDPNFGPTEIFRTSVRAAVAREEAKAARTIILTYQGCAERGICYPPERAKVDVDTLAVTAAGPASPDTADAAQTWTAPPSATQTMPPPASLPSLSGGWARLGLAFAGLGLLLAFTPCVLPMIPILFGMLSRSANGLTVKRGIALSAVYALAMAMAYALLGVGVAWSGQSMQVMLQAPGALAAMAAVFVALAMASFGLFELRLPAALMNRMAGGFARFGPVAGAAALGFSSALIIGPCVTPPLAAALIYVAQTGDVARGAFALFCLGIGMGLPLVAVGAFGAEILPRSGPWLSVTNKAFGFVFLAIAITLMGRIVPAEAAMLSWAILAVIAGVFTGAFDPIAASDGALRRLRKSAGLLAVVYGGTLVVGAVAGSEDPLRPLDFLNRPLSSAAGSRPITTVRNVAELGEALSAARSETRPILLDFTAAWCTACKTMEREVFADPAVQARLRGVTMIRADVTRTDKDSVALMHRFEVVGPPTLLFLDPRDGREIAAARSTGEISAADLRRMLDRVATEPAINPKGVN
jgi:thiol:disulfide interchange protein DsbD